ncbi:hypothetical protein WA158_003615 [Blastocystis sp. Blastoise]
MTHRLYSNNGFPNKRKNKETKHHEERNIEVNDNSVDISHDDVIEPIVSNEGSNITGNDPLISKIINMILKDNISNENHGSNGVNEKIEKIIFEFWISLRINCCNTILGYNKGKESIEIEKRTCSNSICEVKSSRRITIVPIIPRIRQMLKSKTMIQDISFYKKEDILSIINSDQNSIPDDIPLFLRSITYKKYIERLLENGDILLAFSFTCDGISVFSHSSSDYNRSSFPLLIKLLNYNIKRNYDKRSFWTYAITSEYHSWPIMSIIVEEFKQLSKGIEMDIMINNTIQKRKVVGILLNVYGDYAAMTAIGCFSGPSSIFPCRCCELEIGRTDEHFHEGIKCSFGSVSNLIDKSNDNNQINEIRFPIIIKNPVYISFFILLYTDIVISTTIILKDTSCLLPRIIKSIPLEYIYNDAFEMKQYNQRTMDTIRTQRSLCEENESYMGVKKKCCPFESIPLFDISASFSIDTMHLFNNIVTLFLSLLFGFNSEHYSSLVSKDSNTEGVEVVNKYCLSKENMNILNTRIINLNTLYNKYEYEFRLIMNKKKISCVSSHTRIFFFSVILPLITHDFNIEDSSIILLIDPLATIIREVEYDKLFMFNNNIEILRKQCYLFNFLCEVLLPREIINSQIHLLLHLADSIQSVGSYSYGCTYESERFYSKIKRITFGRRCFNESSIKKLIQEEACFINDFSNINNGNISSPMLADLENNVETNIIHDNEYQSHKQFKTIRYAENNFIHSVKGLRESEEKDLNEQEIYYLIKELILLNDTTINQLLFKDINMDLLTNNIDLLDHNSSYNKLKENLKLLSIFYYSEILINESLVFTSTEEDEGIESIDNSYIAYNVTDISNVNTIHLIKSLYYIQINDIVFIRKHEYPVSQPSVSRLYYIINNSNDSVPIESKYGSPFLIINKIIPDNIIISDIHIKKKGEDEDEEYNQEDIHSKNSNRRAYNSSDIQTNTVFTTRYLKSLWS